MKDFVGRISDIPASSIDFAITALNFHDVYNRSSADAEQMLREIFTVLKPSGTLAIIDHEGSDDIDNSALHRITFKRAVQTSIAAGFILTDTSNLLENLKDDHTLSPFDDQIKGRTDRFILKLTKKLVHAARNRTRRIDINPTQEDRIKDSLVKYGIFL